MCDGLDFSSYTVTKLPLIQAAAQQLTNATLGEEQGSTATAALSAERYRPKIYGFQIHEIAKLQRWQEAMRDR
jgi:hypothetical protein